MNLTKQIKMKIINISAGNNIDCIISDENFIKEKMEYRGLKLKIQNFILKEGLRQNIFLKDLLK